MIVDLVEGLLEVACRAVGGGVLYVVTCGRYRAAGDDGRLLEGVVGLLVLGGLAAGSCGILSQ